ncbi:phospholipid-translocating P-type ATPase [Armillaria gallica]|uniref:Phospholipid-transporting ATPase n=1 Tax=Armillaria gallica TaxID=47427 RepID=A0A2H3DP80_ARMGA|nr:phospholipid-translocating P-type ATPase [Armillaria gallica]
MVAAATSTGSWLGKLTSFSIEDLFSQKRPPGPPRTIFVNQALSTDYIDHKGRIKADHVYNSNQVITSKYTILTFVPRNLMEQFRRIANLFFLGLAILQFFPKFSTIAPGVVILPLVIIIGLTAAKDGYEDIKRHQSDKAVNQSIVKVLSGGGWHNPNAIKSKSKTFVRGLLPNSRQPTPAQIAAGYAGNKKHSSNDDFDVEFDYDNPQAGGPCWKDTPWEDVRVGDFVKLSGNHPFPADILICATSDDENEAFVETKNLDGETNLKSRNAVPALTHLRDAYSCSRTAPFEVQCDRPENNMYRLNAMVSLGDQKAPVDIQMTLLRGTVLRNTDWVIGLVLFTGEDSKIVMNSGSAPSKRSRVERKMNPQVLINLAILASLSTICAIVDSALEKHYYPMGAPWLYGDDQSDDNPSINGLVTWAYALLTFQDIVPISLYISIEVVRTLQSAFIYFDKDIWYQKTNQATLARSWNLSDDLGQIQYIFSDKTGTLTQNSMVFRQCSIGGKAYKGDPEGHEGEEEEDSILELKQKAQTSAFASASTSDLRASGDDGYHFKDVILQADIEAAISEDAPPESQAHARALNGFFSVLALCHTVLTSVDPETGRIEYKAQSPDEAALVQSAADMGYVFLGRDKETLSMRSPGSDEPERYELLNILEFNSARKRMSVVLRKLEGDDDRIFLMTKGADNVIFERLKPGGEDLKAETERHLNEFANEGLRTLTLAYKVISNDEYISWSERYHQASVSMDDREEMIEKVSEELERDLRLLGATAIEDRLQDGVPETIADLKRAGIKIWVATGDKLETAIAIGRSTNLVAVDSNIIIVRGGGAKPVEEQMMNAMKRFFPEVTDMTPQVDPIPRESKSFQLDRDERRNSIVGEDNGELPGGFVLVVDGAALTQAFDHESSKQLLLRLGTLCEGVICCRVSPLQKALIVRLVKDNLHVMTLAIGDGANDVSMIQAADVGVGISGEEGLQAVNSSDYAIGQFRFLKKLLLVHGHWSFARNGTLILVFFYKNIVPMGIKFWFQIYCGWSGTFVFDYVYILFWNSLWTLLAVVGIGLFDRILDSQVLMDLPELYHYGRESYWFSMRDFWIYILDGMYQSVIIYFLITYGYFSPTSRSDGYDTHLYEYSTTMAVSGVMVANIFTGMAVAAWTWWLVFAVSFGIVLVWGFTIIYSLISPGYAVTNLYGNYYFLFTSAYFWLAIPLTMLLSLAPRYIAKAWKFGFHPDDLDIIRWVRKKDPYRDLTHDSETHLGIGMRVMRENRGRPTSIMSRRSSRASSLMTINDPYRGGSMDIRAASRTDMATGLVSVDRGFDFATEENGVAIRRIQTNLSERRQNHLAAPSAEPSPSRKGKQSSFTNPFRRSIKKFSLRQSG